MVVGCCQQIELLDVVDDDADGGIFGTKNHNNYIINNSIVSTSIHSTADRFDLKQELNI